MRALQSRKSGQWLFLKGASHIFWLGDYSAAIPSIDDFWSTSVFETAFDGERAVGFGFRPVASRPAKKYGMYQSCEGVFQVWHETFLGRRIRRAHPNRSPAVPGSNGVCGLSLPRNGMACAGDPRFGMKLFFRRAHLNRSPAVPGSMASAGFRSPETGWRARATPVLARWRSRCAERGLRQAGRVAARPAAGCSRLQSSICCRPTIPQVWPGMSSAGLEARRAGTDGIHGVRLLLGNERSKGKRRNPFHGRGRAAKGRSCGFFWLSRFRAHGHRLG